MKKLLVVFTVIFVSQLCLASEIVPEKYLMERLIIPMESRDTYVSVKDGSKIKAMLINQKIMNGIGVTDSPFYIYDSDGNKKMVRVGDYFITPDRLSSIYVITRQDFEENYRDINSPNKKVTTKVDEIQEKVNASDVDEGDKNITEK